jgi:hypothetical protein
VSLPVCSAVSYREGPKQQPYEQLGRLANLNEYQYAAIGESLRRFAEEAYQEFLKTKKSKK